MNCEISKELLSGVLKENIVKVYKIGSNPNFEQNTLLYKLYRCGDICSVNIYELAHKCKEWALEQGYILKSYIDLEGRGQCEISYENFWVSADSEQQTVFDACTYILNKLSNK